jgi:hypothetical protein
LIALQGIPHYPFVSIVALVLIVYVGCLGGVIAVQTAVGGRLSYWLTAMGAVLFVGAVLWGHADAGAGLTLTLVGVGLALSIFGVALDLVFGEPMMPAPNEEPDKIDRGFE